jgi:hypothetical protein
MYIEHIESHVVALAVRPGGRDLILADFV